MPRSQLSYFIASTLLVLASGCSRVESEFEDARRQYTEEAYARFIQNHPQHDLAKTAQQELRRLRWDNIQAIKDPTAISKYLQDYPDHPTTTAAKSFLQSSRASVPETTSDGYATVPVSCVVYHSGYRTKIVTRGISSPDATVKAIKCRDKEVPLSSDQMVDGVIATKEFGFMRVRFASMIATIGAEEFSSMGPGIIGTERAAQVAVEAAMSESFKRAYQF